MDKPDFPRPTRRLMRMGTSQTCAVGSNAVCCHIASMIIQCLPEKLAATAAALSAIPDLEVAERDPSGKLVVLIEADGEANLMACITRIESTAGVISATLAYHQIDA